MDQDDDINPFAEQVLDEPDNNDLATSQSSLARPESPPAEVPPPLLTKQPAYPDPPNYRLAKQKTEFCCERDRWLHSEDGAEIKVGPETSLFVTLTAWVDRGCTEDV